MLLRLGAVLSMVSLCSVARADAAASNVALNANVLGLLQFGPTLAAEFGGRHGSVQFHARVMNAGLLSYVVLPAYYGSDPTFQSGIGIAALGRWYSGGAGNMRGAFAGGGLEWMTYTMEDDEDYTQYRLREAAVIPQVQGGYRWAFDRFLLGVGGGFGLVVNYGNDIEALPDNQEENLYNDSSVEPYGLLFLELGAFL